MRAPRNEYEFDDQLWQVSRSGAPAAVDWLRARLNDATLPKGVTRAFILVELGEYLDMAGEHDAAGIEFRAAVSDQGAALPDARCYLAKWCLQHGDSAEGRRLIDEIWSERSKDPDVYVFVGEIYEERGELSAAIRWFTAGLLRSMRDVNVPESNVLLLLASRRRVRLAHGFTEDDYDEMAGIGMAEAGRSQRHAWNQGAT